MNHTQTQLFNAFLSHTKVYNFDSELTTSFNCIYKNTVLIILISDFGRIKCIREKDGIFIERNCLNEHELLRLLENTINLNDPLNKSKEEKLSDEIIKLKVELVQIQYKLYEERRKNNSNSIEDWYKVHSYVFYNYQAEQLKELERQKQENKKSVKNIFDAAIDSLKDLKDKL